MNVKKMVLIPSITLFAATLLAQSHSIGWHTIDGGGGTSVGGAFSVSGTSVPPGTYTKPVTLRATRGTVTIGVP